MPEDRFVHAHDGIRIAVRDHGGTGPDLLLLHGAGGHLLSLFNLVRKFEDDYRVVTMDARWSGQSGDSDAYDWDDLVADVEAVIEQLGLDRPVVGGHSWGGMIAARYGAAHPDARGVVNLDGHGVGDPSLYDGMTEAEVADGMALLQPPGASGPHEGDAEWAAKARTDARRVAEAMGVPAPLLDEWVERDFVEVEPGRWRRHPSPQLLAGLDGDQRLFDLYRRIECPLQLFNCTGEAPLPPELAPVMAAYRRGLTRALRELADERPGVDVVVLPDFHHNAVLAGGAKVAAAEMRRFISTLD